MPRHASPTSPAGTPEATSQAAPDPERSAVRVASGPAVTVVIRTRDRPHFLARALADVAAQEFTDYEVVVVNDGGDPALAERVLRESPLGGPDGTRSRARLLHREESTGMEAASNAGIRAGSGEFVAIHDDDDLWEPAFLERTVRELRETGAVMVTTRVDRYYERVTPEGFEFLRSEPHWGELHEVTLQDLLSTNRSVPIGILYRRSLHEELGFYDESLPVVGDWEFNLRVAARHGIAMVDELLAYWSHRPDGVGADGNSVYARQRDHQIHDARVRAAAMRRDLAENADLGAYLYQAHLNGLSERRDEHTQAMLGQALERLDGVLGRLEALEERQRRTERTLERRLVDGVRHRWARVRGRLGGARAAGEDRA